MLWTFARSLFRSSSHKAIERALAARKRGDLSAAHSLLRAVVAHDQRNVVAIINLALVSIERYQVEEGAAYLQRALEIEPDNTTAHYNLATLHRTSGRIDDAIRHYKLALSAPNPLQQTRQELLFSLLEICDWAGARPHAGYLRELWESHAKGWQQAIAPFTALYLQLPPSICLEIAAWHAAEAEPPQTNEFIPTKGAVTRPLRIGYLSPDFRDHPVGQLIASFLPCHDRSVCDVFVYSYGPDDGSVYRRSIAAAADHFVDIAAITDEQAATRIRNDDIQLLIDLAGHTSNGRLGILARRPALVQAHYLGYSATTGARYIDYFIGDNIAAPEHLSSSFSETLINVPDCFMVGDTDAVGQTATRSSQGLPQSAMVYACFAKGSRITKGVFDLWLEILRRVPDSVIWLSAARARPNLEKAAAEASIDPRRLVFANRVREKNEHLERLALADLALDTVGWHNGHSTTHDMLRAGVPVLTVAGSTFASRVGASLTSAAGLHEMVARDEREYVETAVRLGNSRSQCNELKKMLAANRGTASFFDTGRLVRGLESTYLEMSYESR